MGVEIKGVKELQSWLDTGIAMANEFKTIEVGFWSGKTYPPKDPRGRPQRIEEVAAIAQRHEFGIQRPRRPFFSRANEWFARLFAHLTVGLMSKNKTSGLTRKDAHAIGKWWGKTIRDSITEQIAPPLSDRRVKEKGHDDTLIDSRLMVRSVQYSIDNGPPQDILDSD